MTARQLSDLGLTAQGGENPNVTGLAVDSREVQAGFLFAALPGSRVHGGEFVQYALRQGAAAILTDAEGARLAEDALREYPTALVVTEDPRGALAGSAAIWFGAQPQTMVAITGTNGKSSVASFTRQLWQIMGKEAINLGTTGVEGSYEAPLAHTTPEPITLHRALSEAAAAGVTHGAMEASSHGLEQRRLDGVILSAAAFTNFTQDHLDYHGTFEAYFDAKARLFGEVLAEEGTAVINMDDPRGADMAGIAEERGHRILTVGRLARELDFKIEAQRFDATGQDLRVSFGGGVFTARMNLIGGFQAENVIVAAALTVATGGSVREAFAAMPHLETVRGRMQLAATRENGATVFVDYAHTPDAVATALKAIRPHVIGRLICVLGAGGDRDAGKRPLMGEAAAQHADVIFVTDDNPRSEDPEIIRRAVMQGCPEATEVADRAEAILRAVDALGPGDTAIILGKGHETGQIVGDTVLPFDDVEQASIAVAALEGRLA
ncbi:MAG: UDP-N-acetylmuramoyl-L-alanyl-D-glutamate--2,6-diaminopimelate ligase [Rhodobacteraceae bacterium]|nr:UDP-N-acetylmuramoyl-L-alanyl-D-glutamate--2,6-diaminopimelate ligase [Paracoccaceae bacterium]